MLKQRAKAFYVVIVAVLIGYFVYTTNGPDSARPFRLGLDLAGGSHLVYKADVSKLDPADIADSMTALRDDVERRVNLFNVSEPLVQTEQNASLSSAESAYKLIVELPGVTDTNAAAAAIGATPNLEFRLGTAKDLNDFKSSPAATGTTTPSEQNPAFLNLFKSVGLTGATIARASLGFNQTTNEPLVQLSFTDEGRVLFAQVTKDHKGDYLGIFLDNILIEAPIINEEIPNGQAQISGGFTDVQAQTLVRNLNYGALPIPITLISQKTIGSTLGQEAVNGGIMAGIVSFILIGTFLIIWYRLPGLIAVIALAIYSAVSLLIFKVGISPAYLLLCLLIVLMSYFVHKGAIVLIPISYFAFAFIPNALSPVTLTAAGIAGFIITIGMAVDANILIFERMKEELRRGRTISDAMHEGFNRAWPSIRDSNISSIITAVILYAFGSTSVITGFALVFLVGVAVSMFTAITASRLMLFAIAPREDTKIARFLISNGFSRSSGSDKK